MRSTGCAIGVLVARSFSFCLLLAPAAQASVSSSLDYRPTPILTRPSPPTDIRIRLSQHRGPFTITGSSLNINNLSLGAGYRALRVSWKFVRSGMATWHVEDRDSGAPLSDTEEPDLHIAGDMLRANLRPVRGTLTLIAPHSKQAEATLIANLDLETYVRGVLPSEMPAGWPLSALKAQAVAARTYAMFRKRERERAHAAFDVDPTTNDQMFTLPGFEEGADASVREAERAVRETRGVVLATSGEHPQFVAAYYHADCGGRTEDARAVWGEGTATYGTTKDAGCPLNPAARWKLSLSAKEVADKILGARAGSASLADFAGVGQTGSGRLEQVRLTWSDGRVSLLAATDFRAMIGNERIKSTNFKWTRVGAGYEFAGQGFGHGVGLCQWGARGLAMNGRTFQEILKHYYPRARLARIY